MTLGLFDPAFLAVATGALWTPASITTALWLDAADASTITLNGSAVSQWNDKSGNGNHVTQATASAQPTYSMTGFNGLPTLSFDAVNDEMSCTDVVSSQGDLFYAAAFRMRSDTANWLPIVGTNTSSSTSNAGTLLLQRMGNRNEIGIHNSGRIDNGAIYAVQVTDLFIPRIATAGRTGGSNGNGGLITVTATGPSQLNYRTTATQTWATDEATNRIQIGGRQQAVTGWSNSDISEVIVCNFNPSSAQRQQVEGYLAHKWGLAASLPSDHPFRDTPPRL